MKPLHRRRVPESEFVPSSSPPSSPDPASSQALLLLPLFRNAIADSLLVQALYARAPLAQQISSASDFPLSVLSSFGTANDSSVLDNQLERKRSLALLPSAHPTCVGSDSGGADQSELLLASGWSIHTLPASCLVQSPSGRCFSEQDRNTLLDLVSHRLLRSSSVESNTTSIDEGVEEQNFATPGNHMTFLCVPSSSPTHLFLLRLDRGSG